MKKGKRKNNILSCVKRGAVRHRKCKTTSLFIFSGAEIIRHREGSKGNRKEKEKGGGEMNRRTKGDEAMGGVLI